MDTSEIVTSLKIYLVDYKAPLASTDEVDARLFNRRKKVDITVSGPSPGAQRKSNPVIRVTSAGAKLCKVKDKLYSPATNRKNKTGGGEVSCLVEQ